MNITKENLIKNGYKYVEHRDRSFYVNSNGDCYTGKRIMKCKTSINRDGYLTTSHNIPIHILVAKAFLKDYKPYSQGYEINHKDCDRLNCNIENLECITHLQNIKYSKNKRHYSRYGVENSRATFKEDEIKQIKKLHNLGNRPYQIIQQLYPKITRKNIKEYKLMHQKISAICKGLSYSK